MEDTIGEITNLTYLRQIGAQRKPIILSTGMANLGEIEAAIAAEQMVQIATRSHCFNTTEYPAPVSEPQSGEQWHNLLVWR